MMRSPRDLTPSVIGFTNAMAACNHAKIWRVSLALYGRMQRAGVAVDDVVIREALVRTHVAMTMSMGGFSPSVCVCVGPSHFSPLSAPTCGHTDVLYRWRVRAAATGVSLSSY